MEFKNFAVFGYGAMGLIHAQNIIEHPYGQLQAIFSQEPTENIPPGVKLYTSYEKLIESEKIDAVIIATPTFTHKDVACYCAEKGLDLFIEKPMALSIEQCDEIINAAEKNGVKLFVGHVLRFWPSYFHVKNYITSSKSTIGNVHTFTAERLGTFPWSDWFADQEKSGGVILDLSIHDIDYASWIFGSVVSVSCKAKKIKKYNKKVYGKSTTTLKFEKEKKAECKASWAEKPDFPFTTYGQILGTKGKIEFSGEGIFQEYPIEIIETLESYDGYYNELSHFIECISSKNKLLAVDGIIGKYSVAICLAAIESANKNGKAVYIEEILRK